MLAIIFLALCVSMALGNPQPFLKGINQLTKHSIGSRQVSCNISSIQNYPSDCREVLSSNSPMICEPRCGQPLVNFYIRCGSPGTATALVRRCGTTSMGTRCMDRSVDTALATRSNEIGMACHGTILSGDQCTTECRNTLTNVRQSLGCCLNLMDTTAITNMVNRGYNRQLWEQQCGVDLPPECPSSLSASTVLRVSKMVLAVVLLLLGVLVFWNTVNPVNRSVDNRNCFSVCKCWNTKHLLPL